MITAVLAYLLGRAEGKREVPMRPRELTADDVAWDRLVAILLVVCAVAVVLSA